MNMQLGDFSNLQNKALFFRVSAHVIIAVIAVMIPSVGPNRFLIAGLMLGVGSPVAIIVNRRVKSIARNWAEALVDLVMVVTLTHLAPHLWMVTMALGLMVALAPSISLHPNSHWIYFVFGIVLLAGMSLAAIVHDVQNWELVIAAVTVTYPALLFYTYSQMRAANDLRKRAEMVEGMSQLAGSVAHDFNNMLMSISGYTELSLAQLPEDHTAKRELKKVLKITKRAGLLNGQLLSFAGRELGRRETIDIVAEFRVIADLLQPALPSGISIALAATERPMFVEASVTDLQQVWMNVLLNAGESMHGQAGVVEVSFSSAEIPGKADSREIKLLISDRGSGISRDALDRVYDPFFTTKEKGHGLGLAVSKRIMQQLHGSIVLRERAGGGTEAELTFPEATAPLTSHETVPQSSELPAASSASLLVLVVDDEAEVREATAGLLRAMGYEVIVAKDADEAIAIFESDQEQIAAVILDLKMPGRDGWSCLQDIRKLSSEKPVIICSGFNPVSQQPESARNDQHLSFLTKPCGREELKAALDAL